MKPTRLQIRRALTRCEREGIWTKKMLGEGGFAVVYDAESTKYGPLALKIARPDKAGRADIVREIDVQRSFDHPNIVRIYHAILEDEHCCIMMEKCDTSLCAFIRDHVEEPVPEDHLRQLFHDIISGLAALHKRNLAHRDIKDENILLKKDPNTISGYTAKLADFGFAKTADCIQTQVGTPIFEAPEVLFGRGRKKYDCKVDMWSVGIMLDIFVEGFMAVLRRKNRAEDRGRFDYEQYIVPPSARKGFSEEMFDLITKLLTRDPERRISAVDALQHPWFQPLFAGAPAVIDDEPKAAEEGGSSAEEPKAVEEAPVHEETVCMRFLGKIEKSHILCESNCIVTAHVPVSLFADKTTWDTVFKTTRERGLFDINDNRNFNEMDTKDLVFVCHNSVFHAEDEVPKVKENDMQILVFSPKFALDGQHRGLTDKSLVLHRLNVSDYVTSKQPTMPTLDEMKATFEQFERSHLSYGEIGVQSFEAVAPRVKILLQCDEQLMQTLEKVWGSIDVVLCGLSEALCELRDFLVTESRYSWMLPLRVPAFEFPTLPIILGPGKEEREREYIKMAAYRESKSFIEEMKKEPLDVRKTDDMYQKLTAFNAEAMTNIAAYHDMIELSYSAVARIERVLGLLQPAQKYRTGVTELLEEVKMIVGGSLAPRTFIKSVEKTIGDLNTLARDMVKEFVIMEPKIAEMNIAEPERGGGTIRRIRELEAEVDKLKRELRTLRNRHGGM